MKSQRLNFHKFAHQFRPKVLKADNRWAWSQRKRCNLVGRFLLDGLQHSSQFIPVKSTWFTLYKFFPGQLQWQVAEPAGSGDRGQGVKGKQPSAATATKGDVSASRDGGRQDEAELGINNWTKRLVLWRDNSNYIEGVGWRNKNLACLFFTAVKCITGYW